MSAASVVHDGNDQVARLSGPQRIDDRRATRASDENGVALDFIQVPDARLKLVAKHSE
jgi:hypothetical protein